ncbi:hypothetical protein E5Q_00157 [Mixia osmundae IAM 14324]|uniref:N-acetyltransferase domain-containing protein n=1 Tax=Mixia osmundae (strain CBS 9802 / IAM 14324 / JCM 22182 / KY 12970) TaxID=764103 RepID=G7DSF6_MIXOS|nr:hypothetical protein E5Q_00157 [Mixia osmundae IAM 14324]
MPTLVRPQPRTAVVDLTPNNIGMLKKINAVVFPHMTYSDNFYADALAPELEPYNKLIYYNDICVGGLCARLETLNTPPAKADQARLYVMTLAILAPYRRQGLAAKLIASTLREAQRSNEPPTEASGKSDLKQTTKRVASIYTHCHTAADEARDFWQTQGFQLTQTVEDYYNTIEPKSAFVFEKDVVQD